MSINNDWDFNYGAKILSHIDGVLSFNGGTAGVVVAGQYVRGETSGAIGKVLLVTGNAVSGTWTLTNVVGLFETGEQIAIMSEQPFDALVDKASSLQGIRVGDTIVDQVTGSIVVRAVEYNGSEETLGAGGGGGTMYGDTFTAFTNNSQLDVSGGETNIGLADTVGTDNDAVLDNQASNGTLAVPGTADTNDSVIIHYDAGTVAIPEQAIVQETGAGARGLVEQVYGVLLTGSLRIVDSDSSVNDWSDDVSLEVDQVIGYNNLVAGQVFSVGDVVVGVTSGATGRVLADTGSQLILADESGTWTTTEDLEVNSVKKAEANGSNTTLAVATINIPDGIRTLQIPNSVGGSAGQGGIYADGDSLNIVRKSNSLYTLSQDTFDELTQMDDDEALDATGKGSAYQIVFDWEVPDLSFRFLRKGAWTDTSGANVWANPQSVGAQNKITDTAFFYSTAQTFKMPQLYIEQNQEKVTPSWLEGNIDVILKVRSRNDTRFIDPATPGLGQLFPGGDPAVSGSYAVFNREFYTSTFDATQGPNDPGGVNTIAMGTGDDTAANRNPNGTHTMNWNTGSAATLVVGETFTTSALLGNALKVGIVVSQTGDAGATGTLEYVLKSGTQFLTTEALVGEVSGKTFAVNGAPTGVVAGYSADIRFQVADVECTPSGGTGITGKFVHGDLVTQATTGATGYLVYADTTNDLLYIEVVSGTFSGDNDITGSVSGSWDAGTGATYDVSAGIVFAADLNNGEGNFNYVGTISMDITDANPESMQNGYQYSKYLSRHEEATYVYQGPGTADVGTVGRFFRKLKDVYAEVKPGNPQGVYTGTWAMAQGWFHDTDFVAAADIRSFTVIDDDGGDHAPPNLQSLTITGVANGWRVSAYRSTGAGLTAILRTEFDVGAIAGSRNAAADTIIRVGANTRTVSPLPADVPDNGVLYVLDPNDTNTFLQFPYTAVDRTLNDFPLTSGDIQDVTGTGVDLVENDNVHVAFIRETATGTSVSATIQYLADIPIVYKARLKGFKPFRGVGTFTDTGASLPAQQTPDAIVDLP